MSNDKRKWFMFYTVHDENDQVVYTGCSTVKNLSMQSIEASERGWRQLGYGSSKFREALSKDGSNWTFKYLTTLQEVTKDTADDAKTGFIKCLGYPKLNVSKNPRASAETAARFAA